VLSARRPLLDETRHRATLVTGDPLELLPGTGVETELLVPFSFFRLRSRQLACFSALVRAMSDISDHAADSYP
jgi:hypothetical protein